ncbi:hypothetical protein N7517_008168 [Penicillium concentricum]|uniref:O-methyltransferase domain-containing protein n=1 Tax=Penicillium concentricum TaxID=293559 RepID=A0A9W9RS69_9EURO|nr:uncharacterized protein N7517_008168 [Penicillium concentricum]KAJ5365282.1 hypothetical protein N7517_008168 [Penicillium concentricum]
MHIKQIQGLSELTHASINEFVSTGAEASRVQAQERALQLSRALERPRDAILKLAFTPAILMAVKIALDMKVFPMLAQTALPVPLAKLAAAKPADPLLVGRILRVLVANAIVDEPVPNEYLQTQLSRELTKRPSIGVIESMFCEFLPSFQKTPEFLGATEYRNPDDPLAAPLQYANNLGRLDGFSWLCQNPDALTRFNDFMEGQRADRPHWCDWFPVHERILDHPDLTSETPLIVDIGGGRGHDLLGFRRRFPDAHGKLILEDLAAVINEVTGAQELAAANIDTQVFDFFNETQPVRGARAYYLKNVLHDWSDEKATTIFTNLKPAMKLGFSKILIEEYVLPDRDASSLPCTTDLAVMVFCSGLERTNQQWEKLLAANGLRVIKYWRHAAECFGIIEVELTG